MRPAATQRVQPTTRQDFAKACALAGEPDAKWPAASRVRGRGRIYPAFGAPFVEVVIYAPARPAKRLFRDANDLEGFISLGPKPLPVFTFSTESGAYAVGHWDGSEWEWVKTSAVPPKEPK